MSRIIGHVEVLNALSKYKKELGQAVQRGLEEGANYILKESLYIVPVDTGDLYSSGFTHRDGRGFRTVVTIGYDTPYAVFVHEVIPGIHGQVYNIKYAAEIASGMYHQRRPQERSKYLEEIAMNTLVQGNVVDFVRIECNAVTAKP